MAHALQTDLLLQSVGRSVKNHKGERIGRIVEVTRNKDTHNIEYVILQSSSFFGEGNRFFAIPASTALVKITSGGKIVLKADKKELQEARGITFDQCPKPTFRFEPSIYELYEYRTPAMRPDPSPVYPQPKNRDSNR